MQYWMAETVYEQFRSDLASAVADRVSWLRRAQPGRGVAGEVVVEARERSLIGLLGLLGRVDAEVRRGILSPFAIKCGRTSDLTCSKQPATRKLRTAPAEGRRSNPH